MGIVKPGAGIAAMVAVAYAAFAPGSPMAEPPAELERPASAFRVLDSGLDTGCELSLAEAGPDGRTPLLAGAGCAAQDALADLRYWSERGDGTVELSGADGAVALRLAGGDGSAFEAFGNGAPLIVLVDAR